MNFFDALVRYETDLWNTVATDLARETGVGLGTLQALRVIAQHAPAARVNEVSRDLGITIGAGSKLVDRLERDGLASRTPHPDDRRSSLISLTESGGRARRSGEEVLARTLERVIGETDVAPMMSMLAELQMRLALTGERSMA